VPVATKEEVGLLAAVVVASVELGVLFAFVVVDSALDISEVDSSVVCVAVERSGRLVSCAVTIGAAKSASSATVCVRLDMRAMAVDLLVFLERLLRLQQCYDAI